MKAEAWKKLIIEATEQHYSSDDSQLDLIVKMLLESEQAKQNLRNSGFGVTGVGLLRTVEEAIGQVEIYRAES